MGLFGLSRSKKGQEREAGTVQSLKARLRDVRGEMRSLAQQAQRSNDLEELRDINSRLDELAAEHDSLEDRLDDLEDESTDLGAVGEVRSAVGPSESQILSTYGVATPHGELRSLGTFFIGTQDTDGRQGGNKMRITPEMRETLEKRGELLRTRQDVEIPIDELGLESRAVTVAAGNLVVPSYASDTLNPTFETVSSLVDLVNSPQLPGGEAYTKGYVISGAEADYTPEGNDYNESDPTFNYVSTGKTKLTVYTEVSEETLKLPAVDYGAEVTKAIRNALRAKLAREIILGAGGQGALTGIASAAAPADTVEDKPMCAGDLENSFLEEIVFSHGGDEAIEGGLWLVLTKADLGYLAKLRTADGDGPLYRVAFSPGSGNLGTLSGRDGSVAIGFCLSSALQPLSGKDTASGDVCMILCKPMGYEMPIFSGLSVERSTDYRFKVGMVAYRGVVFAGGTPASYRNFLRITKKAE